jgi:uncharacterized protein (TIGR02145 family)
VFVDYNDNGVMTRLLVSGATVTSGTATKLDNNDKGAWVINSENVDNFSAIVTLSFTSPPTISGACAYASNYPPEAKYTATTAIEFTGTLPYDLILEHTGGSTITRQSGSLFDVPPSYTLLSFTDKTGAPGVIKCIPPATFTLLASATGFCEDDATGITFALDSTEKDKQYQLFRDNGTAGDGSVLTGNGSALTFTGTFNVEGTYTARTVAEGLTCAIAMNGTHVITKNPLPDNPDVTGDSRNCPGTVTLSASSSGAVIDWYADDVMTSTLHTGESYTTPEIYTSTTYYAQARVESTGCLSARVPVSAEVDMDGCCTAPGATVTFTAFNPCTSPAPASGSTWTLRDTRAGGNSYTYIVKKMADGRIWMVQDLAFGNCTDAPFNNDNSEAATTYQPTVYPGYVGHCTSATTTSTPSGMRYLYNWPAALNTKAAYYGGPATGCSGTSGGTSGTNPGACKGICPTGWHLPTTGEYVALHSNISGSNVQLTAENFGYPFSEIDTNQIHWHGHVGHALTNDQSISRPEMMNYWTSTRSSTYVTVVRVSESRVCTNGCDSWPSSYMMAMRCMMNY